MHPKSWTEIKKLLEVQFLMAKYEMKKKEEFIEKMKTKQYSIKEAAKETGISKSLGTRWWQYYQLNEEAYYTKAKGKYPESFRKYAIKYTTENELSLSEASAVLGIPSVSTLWNWQKIYEREGEEGLSRIRKGRPTGKKIQHKEPETEEEKKIRELEEENEYLKTELAYIKKLIALEEARRNSNNV